MIPEVLSTDTMHTRIFSGVAVDPGANGGIAAVNATGVIFNTRMPRTDRDISDLFKLMLPNCDGVAYLEDIVKFAGRNMPSSSMATYAGNWGFIRGILTALGYRIVLVPPKKWQKALGLGDAKSHGSKTAWKNHLKNRAEQLFPNVTVTLANADALLILEAARRGLLG